MHGVKHLASVLHHCDALLSLFHTMFAPVGFSVIATLPSGFTKCIGLFDYKDQAIDYAKDCDAANCCDLLDRTVYTVKQNYPASAYID